MFSTVCSAAERESHSLMNDKSTRKAGPLKCYIIRHIFENGRICSGHSRRRGKRRRRRDIYLQPIFSYKLQQTRFVLQKDTSLISQKHKVCLGGEELHNPINEMLKICQYINMMWTLTRHLSKLSPEHIFLKLKIFGASFSFISHM